MADWLKIRNEYLSGNISYRKLASKHEVSFNTLKGRAVEERWYELRRCQHNKITTKVQQKTAEVVSTREADRIGRILSAADLLLARVEEAAGQLDTHIVTNRTKTKKTTYNSKSKATKEVTTEEELKAIAPGPVDRLGLQQVAAALKSLKDTVQTVGGDKLSQENNLLETIKQSGEGLGGIELPEVQPTAAADADVVE